MNFLPKKTAVVVALTSTLLFSVGSSNAALNSTLDGVFNGMMSNTTSPSEYQTMRRGVLSGGRISARTNIVRANLVYLDPPSISAGCGGIDIFGGSFSFINKDQLINLARATAQNAIGLLFEVALKQMSPELADSVTKFLSKVQAMNDSMMDSCKMARGILARDVPDEFTDTAKSAADVVTAGAGMFSDIFDSFTSSGGDSSTKDVEDGSAGGEVKQNQLGNPLWNALRSTDVVPVFGGSNDQFREEIMSLTGFIVYDGNSTTDEGNVKPDITSPSLSLSDFIRGGQVSFVSCDNSDCTDYSPSGTTFKGMSDRIFEAFVPSGGGATLVQKIRAGDASAVNEGKVLTILPGGVQAMMVNLIEKSESGATTFLQENADALSLAAAYQSAAQMFQAALQAMQNSNHTHKTAVIEHIRESRRILDAEYKVAADQYGTTSELMNKARQYLEASRLPDDGIPGRKQ